MKKITIIVVAVVAVFVALAGLTAGAWDAPQGHLPQHTVISGQNLLGGSKHALGTILQQKSSAPQGHLLSHEVISGPITPSMRKANPKISPSATAWSCSITAYAGKVSGYNELWAMGSVICTERMDISQQIFADKCNPLLWGCYWTMQYQMGRTCSTNDIEQWCPANGSYVGGVQTGYLWRGRTYACVTPPGDIAHCTSDAVEVQF